MTIAIPATNPVSAWVVCVDQERGKHMAYDANGNRGWGYSEADAVLNLLKKAGWLVVQSVEDEK